MTRRGVRHHGLVWLSAGVLAFAAVASAQGVQPQLSPRPVAIKPVKATIGAGYLTDRVSVKFRDDLKVRARGLALSDLGTEVLRGTEAITQRMLAGAQSSLNI